MRLTGVRQSYPTPGLTGANDSSALGHVLSRIDNSTAFNWILSYGRSRLLKPARLVFLYNRNTFKAKATLSFQTTIDSDLLVKPFGGKLEDDQISNEAPQ